MANRVSASASPSLSNCRPVSGLLADDCTLDTVSSTGARVSKHSPRGSVTRTEKLRRRESPRTLRGTRLSASQQLASYAALSGLSQEKPISADFSAAARESNYAPRHGDGRPDLRRYHSYPNVPSIPPARETGKDGSSMEIQVPPAAQSTERETSHNQPCASTDFAGTQTQGTGHHKMFKQPETNPITEEQLISSVRGIYAGLVMVEKKCIEVDKQQSESKAELSQAQWQALISLHRTLLHEHHDFFLASQHPSASPVLKRLAEEYAMPARMWHHGIHSFLELLRQRLPDSLDHMLNFIYLAYSMVTLLLESVPAFRDIWLEGLGDLARYRMAVEDLDLRDREAWTAVSRHWYNQVAHRSPELGRIQHHLAVLARPDVLQQLFYYSKALLCVQPFPNARENIALLLNPYNAQLVHQHTLASAFLATQGVLFTQGPREQFITRANHFLSLFRWDVRRLDRQGQQSVYIMLVNIAAALQYGSPEAVVAIDFPPKQGEPFPEAHAIANAWTSGVVAASVSDNPTAGSGSSEPARTHSLVLSQPAFQGCCLAFHTLAVLLEQMGDHNVLPGVHISLAFIWCMSLDAPAMQHVEQLIPWVGLARFLNSLFQSVTHVSTIEKESFPLIMDGTHQLPEDFLIRGQTWSRPYYPEGFFEGAPSEEERPIIEQQSTVLARGHRCLWLAVRIATVCYMMPGSMCNITSSRLMIYTDQPLDNIHFGPEVRGNSTGTRFCASRRDMRWSQQQSSTDRSRAIAHRLQDVRGMKQMGNCPAETISRLRGTGVAGRSSPFHFNLDLASECFARLWILFSLPFPCGPQSWMDQSTRLLGSFSREHIPWPDERDETTPRSIVQDCRVYRPGLRDLCSDCRLPSAFTRTCPRS